jgi:hypothetical protein
MHSCDNPSCVNPEHLVAGTQAENMADMVAKGRAARQKGEKNPSVVLKEGDVLRIRSLRGVVSCNVLAREYGVDRSTITCIWTRKTWKHLGSGPGM